MPGRLTIFVICCLLTSWVQAQDVLSQRISIQIPEGSLDQALYQLITEARLNISYNNDLVEDLSVKGLVARDRPVGEILDELLRNTNIEVQVINRQILLVMVRPPPRQYTISGTVEDRLTGEPMIGANIYLPFLLTGTSTNNYGFYSVTIPEGRHRVMVSYLGYQTVIKDLILDGDVKLDISMQSDGALAVIEVTASPDSTRFQSGTPETPLDLRQMNMLPSLGGEPDLIRFASLQPGIQTGTDGFGGVHVRGGNADQNLFLLDGVPVYSPSHAVGMLSIFDSPSIRSASVYKGGFPARYGGRLSSVFDVRMKEGNNKSMQAEASLGLLSAKVALEGPIDQESSSFFISGRRTLFDPWVKSFTSYVNQEAGREGFTDYAFYDINGKMNFRSGNNHRFYVSLYTGNDSYHSEEARSVRFSGLAVNDKAQSDLVWGNTIVAFRWNWLLHPQWFLNTTVHSSSFRFSLLDFYEYEETDQDIRNRQFDLTSFSSLIQDLSLKTAGEYHPTTNHTIRFGASLARHRFQPGVLALDENSIDGDLFVRNGRVQNLDSLPAYPVIQSLEADAFVEDQIQFSPSWSANVGLYANYFYVQETGYVSLQPRLFLRYQPRETFGIHVSYAVMTQNLHLLTNSGLGLPTDLWVPVTGNIRPLQANQIEAGMTFAFDKGWEGNLSAYSKEMEHLLGFKDGANFLVNGNVIQGGILPGYWEDFVTTGTGRSRGIEVGLSKTAGRWSSSLAYTLASTTRQLDEVNSGRTFPFRYDRRHVLNLTGQWQINKGLSLSSVWTYSTGNPITLPLQTFNGESPYYTGIPGIIYSERNGYRMRDYHRLDITLQYRYSQGRFSHLFEVGVFNLYNRRNPLFVKIRENIYNPQERQLVEVSLMPILPILRYQIKFQ
ncbi:MAG: TonB-dependent receptor [Lewinellaceae bacterium]|nr:TonB-dependent receptor [Saprospiraceae bacterium]MCB9311354.1 TonB-dependent receptor [Lewinellaceae bacterium]HRW75150.1 TonB-dependent receptor [Saprospiraceae bacterium]